MDRPVVVVSNRGPLTFHRRRRGARGQTGRGRAGVRHRPARGRHRRAVGRRGHDRGRPGGRVRWCDQAEDLRVRLLAIDPEDYRLAYDVVSNETLWFVHHGLFDLPREPAFDRGCARVGGVPPRNDLRRRGGRDRTRRARSCWSRTTTWPCSDRAWPSAAPTWRRSTSATPRSPRRRGCGCCRTTSGELLAGMAATGPAASTRGAGRPTSRPAAGRPSPSMPRTYVSPLAERRRRRPPGRGVARVRGGVPGDRRGRGRPAGDRAGRPHRAVEEPAAGLPRLRRAARTRPRVAGTGGLPGVGVPVPHGRGGVPRLPTGGRGAGRADQRALGHPGLDPDRARHPRRLPALGGGPAPGRRAAGQPDPRRPEPGGQGGRDRQRAGRGPVPVPGGGRLGRGRRRGAAGSTPSTWPRTAEVLDTALRMPAAERAARAAALRAAAVARRPADWLADQLAAAE